MYIPKAKSGSIVRADFACIQYAQTGIFVMIFDSISERDIPGRAPSWIRIFVICKHENQLRQKIERLLNRKETVFLAADILLIGYPIASGFLGIPAELRALQIKYQICATWI